eukprot:16443315-Heterocapsa_arctica.AAC.1
MQHANPYGDQATADPDASGSGDVPFKKPKTALTNKERRHNKWLKHVEEIKGHLAAADAKANSVVSLGPCNDQARRLSDDRNEIIPPWNNSDRIYCLKGTNYPRINHGCQDLAALLNE